LLKETAGRLSRFMYVAEKHVRLGQETGGTQCSEKRICD
jgi:hypothetical protein